MCILNLRNLTYLKNIGSNCFDDYCLWDRQDGRTKSTEFISIPICRMNYVNLYLYNFSIINSHVNVTFLEYKELKYATIAE